MQTGAAEITEISNTELAQRYLLQSWTLSRGCGWRFEQLQRVLRCVLEIASEGGSIPPLGFVADILYVLNAAEQHSNDAQLDGADTSASHQGGLETAAHQLSGQALWSGPGLDPTLTRRYDDYVLGKLAADMSLERMADELHKYSGRDRDRANAYAIQQIQARADIDGVSLPPSAIKQLQAVGAEDIDRALQTAFVGGYDLELLQVWEQLINCVRNLGELLGPEDLFEMHSGTALSGYGQRIALRQLIQATEYLGGALPSHKPKSTRRYAAVATNIVEEDLYPVGGFSSISNRGTIESLLRSELAYMERDERPDLFDIKFARDELLYYSRDENQFLRRRVSVLLVLDDSLAATRVKDEFGHWQRMIYTLGSVVVTVRTLIAWLTSDSLTFHIGCLSESADGPLQDELDLLEMVFRDEIAGGHLSLVHWRPSELKSLCEQQARQSLCHCVWFTASVRSSTDPLAAPAATIQSNNTAPRWQPLWTACDVSRPVPQIVFEGEVAAFEGADAWREAVAALLGALIVAD